MGGLLQGGTLAAHSNQQHPHHAERAPPGGDHRRAPSKVAKADHMGGLLQWGTLVEPEQEQERDHNVHGDHRRHASGVAKEDHVAALLAAGAMDEPQPGPAVDDDDDPFAPDPMKDMFTRQIKVSQATAAVARAAAGQSPTPASARSPRLDAGAPATPGGEDWYNGGEPLDVRAKAEAAEEAALVAKLKAESEDLVRAAGVGVAAEAINLTSGTEVEGMRDQIVRKLEILTGSSSGYAAYVRCSPIHHPPIGRVSNPVSLLWLPLHRGNPASLAVNRRLAAFTRMDKRRSQLRQMLQ